MNLIKRIFFFAQYFGKPCWDTGKTPPEVVEMVSSVKPGKALDIGCGTGVNVSFLAGAGWQVSGVDFIPLAIFKARRRLKAAMQKAELVVGDASALDKIQLNGPFDLVVDIGCLHSLVDDDKKIVGYTRGLKYWLAPGGNYLLYAHQPNDIESPTHGISRERIEQILGNEFTLIKYNPGWDGNRQSSWYHFVRFHG